jgi:broad specificity phosphatase PhoE
MATLFLIRHAEPDGSAIDPPLSATGHKQAQALESFDVPITWCSPLRRALQTADHLRSRRIILEDLREIDQGEWTGKTWHEIESAWPDLARCKAADWLSIPAPGGEPWPSFLARINKAWQTIRTGPTPAAIVAHQGVNSALAHLIDGRDPLTFNQQYGEVIRVEFD